MKALKNTSVDLLIWFKSNMIKPDADKFHPILNSKEEVCAKI